MAILMFFIWISIGLSVYFIEFGYQKIIMKYRRQFEPEDAILYSMFGVFSVFFFLFTVFVHIQRILERGK